VLILLAILLLVVLPSPWNLVAFFVIVPLWMLELFGWNRTVKRRRKVVGAQTLIGREAVVIAACRPNGQVKQNGEVWAARCKAGAGIGDTVRIVALHRLTLDVEPLDAAELGTAARNGG